MANDQDRALRWIDNAMGWSDRVLGNPLSARVFYEGDRLYSYGRHFELGRVLRTSKGEPRAIILNGDRFSVTTSRHQGMAREAAGRSCLPHLIVPYSALEAARIGLDTIEPLDVREDRTETLYHHAESVSGEHALMDDPSGAHERHETQVWVGRGAKGADDNGYMTKFDYRPKQVPDPNRRAVSRRSNWPIAELYDGLWHWETQRHWLGDSLFTARSHGRRRRFLSSFDYQEARPLYFLCEMPRSSRATTVEQAYEDLKPEPVKMAEHAGIEVARQGDVFAVPTTMSTREVKRLTPYGKGRIVKRPKGGLIGTNHTASEVLFGTEGRVYARGLLYHDPDERASDHARRKMGDGKTWHLLVKNTVPKAPSMRNERIHT